MPEAPADLQFGLPLRAVFAPATNGPRSLRPAQKSRSANLRGGTDFAGQTTIPNCDCSFNPRLIGQGREVKYAVRKPAKLVGSAGNAPVVNFQLCFMTAGLQTAKNKHLLVIYSIPARGFTAAVSVFGGTPPPKPLKCKSVSNRLGARVFARDGQTPPVESLGFPAPEFVWHCLTSSRRQFVIVHRLFTFR